MSDEQMTETLSALLGRRLTVAGYRRFASRKSPPREWIEALDLELGFTDDDISGANGATSLSGAGTGSSPPHAEEPPAPPSEDAFVPPAPRRELVEHGLAKGRIVGAYGMIGYGLSRVTATPEITIPVDACAPGIADLWLRLAAEGDEFAKRVVALSSSGGTKGELVAAHLYMIGAIGYVVDRIPEEAGGVLFAGRFGQARRVVVDRRARQRAEREAAAAAESYDTFADAAADAAA